MFEEVLFIAGIVGILFYVLSFASATEIVSDFYSVDSFSLGQVGEDSVSEIYDSRNIVPVDSGGYFDSSDFYGEVKKFPDEIVIIEEPSSGGGGGGGGGSFSVSGDSQEIYECVNDEDCESDYSCLSGICIVVYDLKILDFESPGRLGENFDFRYFIRRMINVTGDVKTTYWMQDESGNVVGYGSGSLFLEENQATTNIGQFVLNDRVRDGSYRFFVRVDDNLVSLVESVPVELRINGDYVYFKRKLNLPIVIALSVVVIASVFIFIVYNDKLIALWYWFKRRYYDNWRFRIKEYFWRFLHGVH